MKCLYLDPEGMIHVSIHVKNCPGIKSDLILDVVGGQVSIQ